MRSVAPSITPSACLCRATLADLAERTVPVAAASFDASAGSARTGMSVLEVAPGVTRLTKGIVNWYMVEEGGKLTLIDAGTPADWPLLLSTLQATGRRLEDVDAVLLTHAHGDHTGFAERARSEAIAAIHVHGADAAAARSGKVGK